MRPGDGLAWLDAHVNLEALNTPIGETRRVTNPTLDRIAALTELLGSPQLDLPVIHGTLSVDRGTQVRTGEQGYREWPDLKMTLTTDDGRTFSLESDHGSRSDIFQFVPGTDVMAFAGQEISLRGHLDPAGTTLRVTEFAPGHADDFVTGRVVVQRDAVVVRSPAVPRPLHVRYAWADNPLNTLRARNGLPAAPFRTDPWPGLTQPKR